MKKRKEKVDKFWTKRVEQATHLLYFCSSKCLREEGTVVAEDQLHVQLILHKTLGKEQVILFPELSNNLISL